MSKEKCYSGEECPPPAQDWPAHRDYGIPPRPWGVCHDGIRDALGRLIFKPSIVSSTRGFVSANNDAMEEVVKTVNEISTCFNCKVSMPDMQAQVVRWADEMFPDRVPANGFMKFFEEFGEVIKNPRDPQEWADVFIMLFDLADHYGLKGQALSNAIHAKMSINKGRKWTKSETGVMQHVNSTLVTETEYLIALVGGPYEGEYRLKPEEMHNDIDGVHYPDTVKLGGSDTMPQTFVYTMGSGINQKVPLYILREVID